MITGRKSNGAVRSCKIGGVCLWSEIGSLVVWFMFTLFNPHWTEVVFDFREIVDGSYKLR